MNIDIMSLIQKLKICNKHKTKYVCLCAWAKTETFPFPCCSKGIHFLFHKHSLCKLPKTYYKKSCIKLLYHIPSWFNFSLQYFKQHFECYILLSVTMWALKLLSKSSIEQFFKPHFKISIQHARSGYIILSFKNSSAKPKFYSESKMLQWLHWFCFSTLRCRCLHTLEKNKPSIKTS